MLVIQTISAIKLRPKRLKKEHAKIRTSFWSDFGALLYLMEQKNLTMAQMRLDSVYLS